MLESVREGDATIVKPQESARLSCQESKEYPPWAIFLRAWLSDLEFNFLKTPILYLQERGKLTAMALSG